MRVLVMSALVCALVPGLSATAEAQSSLKKLRRCLEFKDMTMPRLICYDAILPPRTKPKPGPAEVVNDCRFLKEDDERLICFNICRESGQASGAKGAVCRAETGRAEGRQQRLLRSMVGMGGKPLDSTLTIDAAIHDAVMALPPDETV